jgi:hypothetical protein
MQDAGDAYREMLRLDPTWKLSDVIERSPRGATNFKRMLEGCVYWEREWRHHRSSSGGEAEGRPSSACAGCAPSTPPGRCQRSTGNRYLVGRMGGVRVLGAGEADDDRSPPRCEYMAPTAICRSSKLGRSAASVVSSSTGMSPARAAGCPPNSGNVRHSQVEFDLPDFGTRTALGGAGQ